MPINHKTIGLALTLVVSALPLIGQEQKIDTLKVSGERIDFPSVDYAHPTTKIIADVKITGAPMISYSRVYPHYLQVMKFKYLVLLLQMRLIAICSMAIFQMPR